MGRRPKANSEQLAVVRSLVQIAHAARVAELRRVERAAAKELEGRGAIARRADQLYDEERALRSFARQAAAALTAAGLGGLKRPSALIVGEIARRDVTLSDRDLARCALRALGLPPAWVVAAFGRRR
jgi:hypothetical protein